MRELVFITQFVGFPKSATAFKIIKEKESTTRQEGKQFEIDYF